MQLQQIFDPISLEINHTTYKYFSLPEIASKLNLNLDLLPYSLRILLENTLRTDRLRGRPGIDLAKFLAWQPVSKSPRPAIAYQPARVLLQDLTGVPVIADLASLRNAASRAGRDPDQINPLIPVDLVVDHSIQVDSFGTIHSARINQQQEYKRNQERFQLLKWAQKAFRNVNIIPPGKGIVHQVNLEFLSSVVCTRQTEVGQLLIPDTVIGTDSHTTMINGLGVLGWGVGGIEAIAAMLAQPVEVLLPDVVGVHVSGKLPAGSMPTDIVLKLTHELRQLGVVNKIVEFYGDALDHLSVPDRAMLANMAPEYGATCAYFPVDQLTLDYLELTARTEEQIKLVERYFQSQELFRKGSTPIPQYSQIMEFNLSEVTSALAGPRRPQDLIQLSEVSSSFSTALMASKDRQGYAIAEETKDKTTPISVGAQNAVIEHGSVVLAAITSCTNTSNPIALIAAGLVAKKACLLGLQVKPFTKTSFTPGSRVVASYMEKAGLQRYLDELGFNIVGFGCATCIGNSGPLIPEVTDELLDGKWITAAVLSGNRNFEGRIHPLIQANYLASPALVVAYALAGNIRKDLTSEPIGEDQYGNPVFLKDIWPSADEIAQISQKFIDRSQFQTSRDTLLDGDDFWNSINAPTTELFPWNPESTYLKEPPFCQSDHAFPEGNILARALAIFGDSITTDHISPAGSISPNTPAAEYLSNRGVKPEGFNSYGARRGNHEVMMRGTFANIRIKNQMVPGVEGGYAIHYPDGEQMTIFEAADKYRTEGMPLLILAGKEYGTGSSRDWAAKGPLLLGIKVVIAESFERIHRSNLIGMGILPLQFFPGVSAVSLGLTGRGEYIVHDIGAIQPGSTVRITGTNQNAFVQFQTTALIHSEYELECLKAGGVFQMFMKA
jgi:aconitate hydratase